MLSHHATCGGRALRLKDFTNLGLKYIAVTTLNMWLKNGRDREKFYTLTLATPGELHVVDAEEHIETNIGHLQISEAMALSASALAYKMGAMDNNKFRLVQFQFGAGLGYWTYTKKCGWLKWFLFYFQNPPIGILMLLSITTISAIYILIPLGIILIISILSVLLPPEKVPWTFDFPSVISQHQLFDVPIYGGNPLPERVYLTDGAHAENLGVLPLLERRCFKKIVICDGTCDLTENFNDLRTLLLRARTKLKCSFVSLHNPLDDVDKEIADFRDKSDLPYMQFKVVYDQQEEGKLDSSLIIYLKSRKKFVDKHQEQFKNIYGCCCECCNSRPYCHIQALCGFFPHHLTSIQFFTPLLFEEYSKLGHMVATEFFDNHYNSEVLEPKNE